MVKQETMAQETKGQKEIENKIVQEAIDFLDKNVKGYEKLIYKKTQEIGGLISAGACTVLVASQNGFILEKKTAMIDNLEHETLKTILKTAPEGRDGKFISVEAIPINKEVPEITKLPTKILITDSNDNIVNVNCWNMDTSHIKIGELTKFKSVCLVLNDFSGNYELNTGEYTKIIPTSKLKIGGK